MFLHEFVEELGNIDGGALALSGFGAAFQFKFRVKGGEINDTEPH